MKRKRGCQPRKANLQSSNGLLESLTKYVCVGGGTGMAGRETERFYLVKETFREIWQTL